MKEKDLHKKLAKLETMNDQLAAEIQYLESLTRALGFVDGLKTLKAAAKDMLESDHKKLKTEGGANPPLSN
jgi:cell division protein FtsB